MRTLVVTLLLVPISLAMADPAADSMEVTVGIPKVAPWAEEDGDNQYYGALVDMVNEMDQRTDVRLVPRVRPYNRVLLELRNGDVDLAMVFEFPEAEAVAEKVLHVLTMNTYVLGRGDDEPIESLSELNGENVGYIQGAYYGEDFVAQEGFNKVPVRDFAHGLSLMEQGRLRAMVSGEVAMVATYDPERHKPIRKIYQLEGANGVLYRSRSSPVQLDPTPVRDAIVSILEDGTWELLMQEWVGEPSAP